MIFQHRDIGSGICAALRGRDAREKWIHVRNVYPLFSGCSLYPQI